MRFRRGLTDRFVRESVGADDSRTVALGNGHRKCPRRSIGTGIRLLLTIAT